MSDDTPTERLAEATEDLAEERKKSSVLMIVLIAVGALLLIGLVVLLVLLFTRPGDAPAPAPTTTESSSPTPTESPTPAESATPTPTVTPTPTQAPPPPPPPDTAPGFVSFNQGQTVSCNSTPGLPGYTPPAISFNYTTKNASSVWFVFGESDAANAGAFPMPLSGNQDDVYGSGTKVEYPCGAAEAKFTLTIVGTNGQHVNRTFTVRNNGDVY